MDDRGDFEDWYLHDGTLHEVRFDWRERVCRILVSAFIDPSRDAERRVLVFSGVTSLRVPRNDPWGRSSFINRTYFGPDGEYLIEVQSGDVIEIRATRADFAAADAGPPGESK